MTSPPENPKRTNILVVDDSVVNLQLLVEMLGERGYKVRPAPTGKLALQAAETEPPDLILLDISMPVMNGFEVCQKLKANPKLQPIPVIFISGRGETTEKVKAFAVGGVDYITKPFHIEEVEARIRTHLDLRKLQTELEEKNQQLQQSFDKLNELESLRRNLVHLIVHDLRSPLQGLVGYLELVRWKAPENLDKKLQSYIDEAFNNSNLLVEMINTLLDIGRLEEGKMPMTMQPGQLTETVQHAINALGAIKESCSISFQAPPQNPPLLFDHDLIRRVITNLLSNAARFSPRGSTVTVKASQQQTDALISVTDHGPGIPKDSQQSVFDKFSQLRQNPGSKNSSGLGLTFCKLAIEAHGGSIGVESEPGEGATFWFKLPLDSGAS